MSGDLNKDSLPVDEHLEILGFIDKKLEQIELLLYKMDALARQAAGNVSDAERKNFQGRMEKLKEEIDRIATELHGQIL